MGLSKQAIQKPKKTHRQALKDDFKVRLTYKSSPEADFRLFKALSMLLSEEDIIDNVQKSSRKGAELKQKQQKMA